ncbi:FAD-dependent oxidoreductase, partial [Streptomyces carpinensis]
TGRLAGPRRVTVGDRTFEARRGVVPATGARPRIPAVPGLEGTPYWTDRDAMAAKELPASMVVLGGGAIGVELAEVFARFTCAVTVIEGRAGPAAVAGGARRSRPPWEPSAEPHRGRVEGVTVPRR